MTYNVALRVLIIKQSDEDNGVVFAHCQLANACIVWQVLRRAYEIPVCIRCDDFMCHVVQWP